MCGLYDSQKSPYSFNNFILILIVCPLTLTIMVAFISCILIVIIYILLEKLYSRIKLYINKDKQK